MPRGSLRYSRRTRFCSCSLGLHFCACLGCLQWLPKCSECASLPGFPWRFVSAESARSFRHAATNDVDRAVVAPVAVRNALYVRAWVEAGDTVEARLFQRLGSGEDSYRTALVLVALVNDSKRFPRDLTRFGSNYNLEEQFDHPDRLSLRSSSEIIHGYKVWYPSQEPVVAADPVVPRGDLLIADANFVCRVSGWHFWIAADLKHTTRACQIAEVGASAVFSQLPQCTTSVGLVAGPKTRGWGAGELLSLPVHAFSIYKWEGVSLVTAVLPSLVVAMATVYAMLHVSRRWEQSGESKAEGLLIVDLFLLPAAAMYSASATHRAIIGVIFLRRGLMPVAITLLVFIFVFGILAIGAIVFGSWAHIRRQMLWNPRQRAVFALVSFGALWFPGAGTFAGPLLGLIAPLLPFAVLSRRLYYEDSWLFCAAKISMFCVFLRMLCCGWCFDGKEDENPNEGADVEAPPEQEAVSEEPSAAAEEKAEDKEEQTSEKGQQDATPALPGAPPGETTEDPRTTDDPLKGLLARYKNSVSLPPVRIPTGDDVPAAPLTPTCPTPKQLQRSGSKDEELDTAITKALKHSTPRSPCGRPRTPPRSPCARARTPPRSPCARPLTPPRSPVALHTGFQASTLEPLTLPFARPPPATCAALGASPRSGQLGGVSRFFGENQQVESSQLPSDRGSSPGLRQLGESMPSLASLPLTPGRQRTPSGAAPFANGAPLGSSNGQSSMPLAALPLTPQRTLIEGSHPPPAPGLRQLPPIAQLPSLSLGYSQPSGLDRPAATPPPPLREGSSAPRYGAPTLFAIPPQQQLPHGCRIPTPSTAPHAPPRPPPPPPASSQGAALSDEQTSTMAMPSRSESKLLKPLPGLLTPLATPQQHKVHSESQSLTAPPLPSTSAPLPPPKPPHQQIQSAGGTTTAQPLRSEAPFMKSLPSSSTSPPPPPPPQEQPQSDVQTSTASKLRLDASILKSSPPSSTPLPPPSPPQNQALNDESESAPPLQAEFSFLKPQPPPPLPTSQPPSTKQSSTAPPVSSGHASLMPMPPPTPTQDQPLLADQVSPSPLLRPSCEPPMAPLSHTPMGLPGMLEGQVGSLDAPCADTKAPPARPASAMATRALPGPPPKPQRIGIKEFRNGAPPILSDPPSGDSPSRRCPPTLWSLPKDREEAWGVPMPMGESPSAKLRGELSLPPPSMPPAGSAAAAAAAVATAGEVEQDTSVLDRGLPSGALSRGFDTPGSCTSSSGSPVGMPTLDQIKGMCSRMAQERTQ